MGTEDFCPGGLTDRQHLLTIDTVRRSRALPPNSPTSAVAGTQAAPFCSSRGKEAKGSKEIKTLYSLTLLVKDRGTSKP
jgi:hypothetical protein